MKLGEYWVKMRYLMAGRAKWFLVLVTLSISSLYSALTDALDTVPNYLSVFMSATRCQYPNLLYSVQPVTLGWKSFPCNPSLMKKRWN